MMQGIINSIVDTPVGELLIIKKLGKGKSGISYLAECNNVKVVYKQMHNEPCPYYSFSDKKVNLEVNAFNVLKNCGILIPDLLYYDVEDDYLIKEFIDGICGDEWIASGREDESVIEQLFKMYVMVRSNSLNIDYFPANFVISNENLYYIDYEINAYSYEWGLEQWGIYYWANRDGMSDFINIGAWQKINEMPGSGIPIKAPFEEKVEYWKSKFLNNCT